MKLKVAAKATAVRGPIDLVDTAVAMAFGASVQPFTRITPSVSITVKRKGRFPEIPEINSPKVMTIPLLTDSCVIEYCMSQIQSYLLYQKFMYLSIRLTKFLHLPQLFLIIFSLSIILIFSV